MMYMSDRILYDSELDPLALASRRHTQKMLADFRERALWLRNNFEQYAKDHPDSEFVKNLKSNHEGMGDFLQIPEFHFARPNP